MLTSREIQEKFHQKERAYETVNQETEEKNAQVKMNQFGVKEMTNSVSGSRETVDQVKILNIRSQMVFM